MPRSPNMTRALSGVAQRVQTCEGQGQFARVPYGYLRVREASTARWPANVSVETLARSHGVDGAVVAGGAVAGGMPVVASAFFTP